MRSARTAAVFGAAVAVALVVGATTTGWACVPVATVQATPPRVAAGQELTVTGIRFLGPNPVTLRLHGVDGPVVATLQMLPMSNTLFKTTITVPPDTPPGPLVVVAMQDANPALGVTSFGVPARDVVTVVDSTGASPPPQQTPVLDRPADLTRASVETSELVLVALGVAATALLVAGAVALVAGRAARSDGPTPAPVGAADR